MFLLLMNSNYFVEPDLPHLGQAPEKLLCGASASFLPDGQSTWRLQHRKPAAVVWVCPSPVCGWLCHCTHGVELCLPLHALEGMGAGKGAVHGDLGSLPICATDSRKAS